jgi:sec-independent protein translocase protein TatA
VRLGWLELLVILGVVLLFFGPKRLPGLGNALGSAIRGFKRGISGAEDDAPSGAPAQDKLPPPSPPETKV